MDMSFTTACVWPSWYVRALYLLLLLGVFVVIPLLTRFLFRRHHALRTSQPLPVPSRSLIGLVSFLAAFSLACVALIGVYHVEQERYVREYEREHNATAELRAALGHELVKVIALGGAALAMLSFFNGRARSRAALRPTEARGLTTRCSGLATLAAELDIVRRPSENKRNARETASHHRNGHRRFRALRCSVPRYLKHGRRSVHLRLGHPPICRPLFLRPPARSLVLALYPLFRVVKVPLQAVLSRVAASPQGHWSRSIATLLTPFGSASESAVKANHLVIAAANTLIWAVCFTALWLVARRAWSHPRASGAGGV